MDSSTTIRSTTSGKRSGTTTSTCRESSRSPRTTDRLPLVRVPRPPGGDGFANHRLQHFLVHVGELLDVKAALASGVLAELGKQRLRVAGPHHGVKNGCGLTRRKTYYRHVA